MITKTVNLYQYSELSEDAKENARQWWRKASQDDDWWDYVQDEAKETGVSIEAFDVYYKTIEIELNETMPDIIAKINEIQGKESVLGKLAAEYEAKIKAMPEEAETQEQEEAAEELENDFKIAIGEIYLRLLRDQMEYQESEEYIADTMEANEYTFTEDGQRMD